VEAEAGGASVAKAVDEHQAKDAVKADYKAIKALQQPPKTHRRLTKKLSTQKKAL
jgi:hypothetical protein